MANLLEKLRKENNARDKLLTKQNNLIMTDMVVYLRSSDLCDYDIEVIRRELFGMIYEAQVRKEPASHVIGDDYKGFCTELMKSGRQKDFYEKFLEWAYIGVVGIGTLFVIELIFSGFVLEPFVHGNISMPVSYGFLISTCLIIVGALVVYWFFTKYSFELSRKGLSVYKVCFFAGFTFFFAGTLIIKRLLGDKNLFEINVLIPASIFAAAYLLVKVLTNRNANHIAETHS